MLLQNELPHWNSTTFRFQAAVEKNTDPVVTEHWCSLQKVRGKADKAVMHKAIGVQSSGEL